MSGDLDIRASGQAVRWTVRETGGPRTTEVDAYPGLGVEGLADGVFSRRESWAVDGFGGRESLLTDEVVLAGLDLSLPSCTSPSSSS